MNAIIPQADNVVERYKLEKTLLAQHRDELAQASWWKRLLIRYRIHREVTRTLSHRLSAQKLRGQDRSQVQLGNEEAEGE